MNKKLNTIVNTSPPMKEKSAWMPALGIVVFSFCVFWAVNHIAGGCTDVSDVLEYCAK